ERLKFFEVGYVGIAIYGPIIHIGARAQLRQKGDKKAKKNKRPNKDPTGVGGEVIRDPVNDRGFHNRYISQWLARPSRMDMVPRTMLVTRAIVHIQAAKCKTPAPSKLFLPCLSLSRTTTVKCGVIPTTASREQVQAAQARQPLCE